MSKGSGQFIHPKNKGETAAKSRFVDNFRITLGTYQKAANLSNVDLSRVWEWKKEDESFKNAIESVERELTERVEQQMYANAVGQEKAGNTLAQAIYLRHNSFGVEKYNDNFLASGEREPLWFDVVRKPKELKQGEDKPKEEEESHK